MNIPLFLTIFITTTIIYLLVGLYASKNIKNTSDYFLAGRKLNFFQVTSTLIATQIGGGMLLGTSQKAYEIGLYGILYTLGMSIGFIILSMGFASRLQAVGVETTAQLFETKYKNNTLRQLASILSIGTLLGIFIGQIVASKTVLNGIGLNNEFLFLGLWSLIIIYTITGGLKAVVLTDVVQILLIIFIFGGIFIYSFLFEKNVLASILSFTNAQTSVAFQQINFYSLIPILLMPALFSLIEQDLAQRFFASKTKSVATLSALASGVFLVCFAFVPIYFGIKAKLLGIDVPENSSPLVAFLKLTTNEFFFSLAICGIIAAIVSTADSLLCAISSNLSQDFSFGTKNKLRISKIITLITGIFAIGASYFASNDIINILIESYELSVSCLFVPLIASLFLKKPKEKAALISMFSGLIGFTILQFFNIPLFGFISLLLSLIGFIIGQKIK